MEQIIAWGLMLILTGMAVGALFLCIHLGKMAFRGRGKGYAAAPRGWNCAAGSRQVFSPF